MSEEKSKEEIQRHSVRLPGFIRDEDIGLGDAVSHVTRALGIRPCGGCHRRAAALNRWVRLPRRTK